VYNMCNWCVGGGAGRGGSLSFSRKKKSTKEVQTTIDDCTHPHTPVKIVLHIYIFLEVY
jgi:hypothetical protein